MRKKGDDAESRAAAREVYERIRGARDRARKGADIVDIQKSVTETAVDATKAVKRPTEAVQDEGNAAGATLHPVVRSTGRSLGAIGARVRQNRYRFT
jgi:hypothetical protein